MPKASSPPTLDLRSAKSNMNDEPRAPLSPSTLSPTSLKSPRSPPGSPYQKGSTIRTVIGENKMQVEDSHANGSNSHTTEKDTDDFPQSPTITAIPQYPPSPKGSSRHGRDPSKSFFGNLKASKSSHRLQSPDGIPKEVTDKNSKNRTSSKDRTIYASSRARGSTPDLLGLTARSEKTNAGTASSDLSARQPSSLSSQSNLIQGNDSSQSLTGKKSKPRFGGFLARSRSIRMDEGGAWSKPSTPATATPDRLILSETPEQDPSDDGEFAESLKTAPLQQDRDRSFKTMMGSSVRNRSADRPSPVPLQDNLAVPKRDRSHGAPMTLSSSFKEGAGAQLLSNLQHTSKGAADRLGKAGKGFFGKITRSGSSTERELVTDDTYQCSVISLPLVRQTRKTRIAKKLSLSKDKTEYWMPALPWRCIDYLNMNGCEEEGLYRIPGSGRDVKHWQRRFDTEYDINLFDEPELYDINTIGSMFKAWLRDLPDEIFPKATQARIAEKCLGATTTPQVLKDELSKLPPFNYYLLFAITCHLSLLHSFADKNKMDYRNLCICFQPCLRIEGFCFQFLVQDWKNCWQGCWTEKEYTEEEDRFQREGDLAAMAEDGDSPSPPPQGSAIDDRAISSSGSNQPVVEEADQPKPIAIRNGSPHQGSKAKGSPRPLIAVHGRTDSQLPELGPPLSPIKI